MTPFGESDLRRKDVVERVGVECDGHDGDATQRNGGDETAATNAGTSGATTPRTSTRPDQLQRAGLAVSRELAQRRRRSAKRRLLEWGTRIHPDSTDGRAEAERLWCAGVW